MSARRVFITGSSDGLGLEAGRLLAADGHRVTLHARNDARARDAKRALPSAESVVVGDVSAIAETRAVAEQVNALGKFDAVIHNVGVGTGGPRAETVDGLPRVLAVNVIAPYLLTALIARPARLIYLSSGLHTGGSPDLDDAQWVSRRWNGSQAYADSKLFDIMLAFGVARRWPKVLSNAVDPGWVKTKMGGSGAPDGLEIGATTQAWLAVSDDGAAKVTGEYFYHKKTRRMKAEAKRVDLQDRLLDYCAKLTGATITE